MKQLKLLLSIMFVTSLFACKEDIAQIGHQAPPIAVLNLQDEITSIPVHQVPTLITFWSESCGICIKELQEFSQFHQQYPHKLAFLAINIDGEKGNIQKVIDKYKLNIPIVKDQFNITAERYQVRGTPTSFIIDENNILLHKYEGLIPKPEFDEYIVD